MGLMPQMVDAVVGAMFEPVPAVSNSRTCKVASNRESPRTSFHGRAAAVVFPLPSEHDVEPFESEVLTTDISRGGLSLLHREELFPGQQIMLQLSQENRTVEVCWCCQIWADLYIAGCRYVDPILHSQAVT
jgi:hypothetical protein